MANIGQIDAQAIKCLEFFYDLFTRYWAFWMMRMGIKIFFAIIYSSIRAQKKMYSIHFQRIKHKLIVMAYRIFRMNVLHFANEIHAHTTTKKTPNSERWFILSIFVCISFTVFVRSACMVYDEKELRKTTKTHKYWIVASMNLRQPSIAICKTKNEKKKHFFSANRVNGQASEPMSRTIQN